MSTGKTVSLPDGYSDIVDNCVETILVKAFGGLGAYRVITAGYIGRSDEDIQEALGIRLEVLERINKRYNGKFLWIDSSKYFNEQCWQTLCDTYIDVTPIIDGRTDMVGRPSKIEPPSVKCSDGHEQAKENTMMESLKGSASQISAAGIEGVKQGTAKRAARVFAGKLDVLWGGKRPEFFETPIGQSVEPIVLAMIANVGAGLAEKQIGAGRAAFVRRQAARVVTAEVSGMSDSVLADLVDAIRSLADDLGYDPTQTADDL